MHEDEEMKAQCYGGDYMGEVYDDYSKRVQFRKQKRWWNAYMLFYTRCDQQPSIPNHNVEQLSLAESRYYVLPMPEPIAKSVRSQNLRYLQMRSFFSLEFFNFIKKLVNCAVPPPSEKLVCKKVAFALREFLNVCLNFLFLDTRYRGTIVVRCSIGITISVPFRISYEENTAGIGQ